MSDRRYYGVARGRQGEFIAAIEADAASVDPIDA
jgi:hypothetical protein